MPFPAPYPRTKDGDGFLAIDLASDTGKKMVWLKLFTVKYQSQECMQGLLIQGTSMQSDTQHAPLLTSVCSFLCTVGAPDLVPFYQTPEVCSPPPEAPKPALVEITLQVLQFVDWVKFIFNAAVCPRVWGVPAGTQDGWLFLWIPAAWSSPHARPHVSNGIYPGHCSEQCNHFLLHLPSECVVCKRMLGAGVREMCEPICFVRVGPCFMHFLVYLLSF